ncbi:MAG: hypothetical protein Q8P18_33620 [Pseudomonadota bacterium]|nr:hypothetical protein [Pseudomonadota bacterium]
MSPRPIALRWLLASTLIAPLLLLSSCSAAERDEFFEDLALIIIFAMVVAAVMAFIGLVLVVVQLVTIVLNFVRPSVWSMVAGYVFAGLQVLSVFGSILMMTSTLSGAEGDPPVDPDAMVTAIATLFGSVGFGALLAGSSYYAQRKLADAKAPPAPA